MEEIEGFWKECLDPLFWKAGYCSGQWINQNIAVVTLILVASFPEVVFQNVSKMFIVNKWTIGFHFLKRFLYLRERMRIQWLSPQMATVTAAGSIQSQEPDDSSWSSTWVQVTKDLGPPPLPSHTISRRMDRSEVNGDFNWHCMASWCHRWQLYLLSHSTQYSWVRGVFPDMWPH